MAGSTKKRKTAAEPKTKAKSGRTAKANETANPESGSFIRAEVMIIVTFACAVLLFLSNFHLCGVVGDFLRSVQLGIFGMVGFLFPIVLFVGACFYLANRGRRGVIRKLVATAVALVVLCAFCQLLFGADPGANEGIFAYYRLSAENVLGGGLVGGLVKKGLTTVIGTVGAWIVLLVLLMICLVIITERSIVNAVRKGGGTVYQHARDDVGRMREQQRERRRLLEEQRVRGVDLGATDLSLSQQAEPSNEEELLEEDAETAAAVPRSTRIEGSQDDQCDKPEENNVRTMSPLSDADVFTGNILPPLEYDEDDDTVPFETEEASSASYVVPSASVHTDFIPADSLPADSVHITVDEEEPANPDEVPFIASAEGERRVVTASGKVIERDTEALQKKAVTKRKKAADPADDAEVANEVKEKEQQPKKEYVFPPLNLLTRGIRTAGSRSDEEYRKTAIKLQQTLRNFGVGVMVTDISCGPSVTRYELHPEQGVKVSRIVSLQDDIKLSLAAEDIRIEAPIPGKSAVGIEVPNKENTTVYLRDLLESESFQKHPSRLAFAVGKDIGGQAVVADIAKMPHLLIAGATGSGKSVCINTIIMSVLYKSSPDDVKLIMIDPKVVELSVYNGIPHLLIPVVTDPKKASGALNWAVAEMTTRYKTFADYNVRDLKGYNAKIESMQNAPGGQKAVRGTEDSQNVRGSQSAQEENRPKKMAQIIIIIDELADLMMVAPGEVEDAICRLAQLARAAGIHLVIATQRPSVNVITGLIKANVPSRIAFAVSQGVDSRTIIDMNGAEKLLGKGDMLFYPAGYPKPKRVQGALVSDQEVQKVVDFLTEQGLTADYSPEVEKQMNSIPAPAASGGNSGRDEYFEQAGRFIIEKEKASIGMLQRMFKVGFNRAARIMDQLADAGVVGEEEGTKPRKILMTMAEFEEMLQKEN